MPTMNQAVVVHLHNKILHSAKKEQNHAFFKNIDETTNDLAK